MTTQYTQRFDQACEGLCQEIATLLYGVPSSIKQTTCQIRLRANLPLVLCAPNQLFFVKKDGQVSKVISPDTFVVTPKHLEQSFQSLCGHSVHSHEADIQNGFLTIQGGHRAGICGTGVLENGKLKNVRSISSINLRVARAMPGAAKELFERLFQDGLHSVLLVGPPLSGKTTLLRDLAVHLANGQGKRYYQTAVIDERSEIAAVYKGSAQNDIGVCCDVLNGYPKAKGMEIATRTLSPDVIILDEIGSKEDAQAILDGANAGVHILASAHASSLQELMRKPYFKPLFAQQIFDYLVLLKNGEHIGKIQTIVKASEQYAETYRSFVCDYIHDHDGDYGICFAEETGEPAAGGYFDDSDHVQ